MAKNAKRIVETTTNRGEFNRAYKAHLEHQGNIHCGFCGYHRGENGEGKRYYDGYERANGNTKINYPNWKLVSKNRKQWMKKSIKFEYKESGYGNWKKTYITLKWE